MEAKKERGITLIALIITVIILVILSAVGISAVYNSRIIEYAIKGAQDYGLEGINENKVIQGAESLIGSAVSNLSEIGGGSKGGGSSSEEPEPKEKHKITYYIYNNTEKTEEVEGEITLPNIENITVDGEEYIGRGWGTSTEANAEVIASGTKIKVESDTVYYASYAKNITATFYYNSNTTSESITLETATETKTKYINYVGEKTEGTLTIPTEVTSSVGKYNSPYVGVSSSTNVMSTTNTISEGVTYYAVYRSNVTIYYPNSKTTATNMTKYRNEYFTSTSAMNTVLSTSSTGTTDFTFSSNVSGYSLQGFNISANTTGRTYSCIEELRDSNATTAYAILYKASGSNTYYTYCINTTTAKCTEPEGMTSTDLAKTAMIGKYVNYKPAGSNYTVDGTYSGTGSNQTFSANNSMKWRIWGVEDNKLLLISETLAGNMQLNGANGYNNGVKILNDACSTAFGNLSYGSAIHVRSINQEDIDKVTNMTEESQRKAVYSYYGSSDTPSKTNWPNIYGQESGKTGGGSLDRSSQSSWYTGTTNSSFTGKFTCYNYTITNYATQTMYDALLTNMTASSTTGTTSHTEYWVASRCVLFSNNLTWFYMHRVSAGGVYAGGLYRSDDHPISSASAVRPMVEIDLGSIAIGATGTGTNTDPYSMVKK